MTRAEIEKAIAKETKPLNFWQRATRLFRPRNNQIILNYHLDNSIPPELADGTMVSEQQTIYAADGRTFHIYIFENMRYPCKMSRNETF